MKVNTNHPWVKGIQVCSNKGPDPLQMGDNHKNLKMGWGHLTIFIRTQDDLCQVQLKLAQSANFN
jgi:hypothetical protein